MIEWFVVRLKDSADPEIVHDDLAGVVSQALEPAQLLRLQQAGKPEVSATYSPGRSYCEPGQVLTGEWRGPGPGADRSFLVPRTPRSGSPLASVWVEHQLVEGVGVAISVVQDRLAGCVSSGRQAE